VEGGEKIFINLFTQSGQERDPSMLASPSPQQWPESFSPRTASPFRHLYPSTPPLSRAHDGHYPSPPPVHLGHPNFPTSRPLFPPFELSMGVSSGRRFSPSSLPFPPSTESSASVYQSFNTMHTGSPVLFNQPANFTTTTTSSNTPSQQPSFSPAVNPSQFEFKPVSRYPDLFFYFFIIIKYIFYIYFFDFCVPTCFRSLPLCRHPPTHSTQSTTPLTLLTTSIPHAALHKLALYSLVAAFVLVSQ
jgi:hypothetical protein